MDKNSLVKSKTSSLALSLGLLLVTSLALNVFLGWKVVTQRGAIARENLDRQLAIGTSVPPITAKAIDGHPNLINYVANEKPTVLYFFSPGCDTCERNVENIKRLVDTKRGEYHIVGLSLSEDGLEQFAKAHDLNFPVYSGLGVETTLSYKLGRVPQTTVVSGEGKVLANWNGAYDGKLRAAIESYFHFSY